MNSELLYITRKLGYPSSFGTRAGLGDFLEQYPDGVYAENGGGAPIGWESAAVWFGGDSERAAARFERMMSERNELSRLFRTRVSGVLVLTFIYRLKSRMVTAIPIIGGKPSIDPTWLYFTMPEGGTVTLTKNGTPTEVTLEYSLDNGNTWTEWVESENVRSLALAAGQTMHVRNTSETSTSFSTSDSNYYQFAFSTDNYAGGNTDSLLCKNPSNATITAYCYYKLFRNCTTLITPSEFPSSYGINRCYASLFYGCSSLIRAPYLSITQSSGIHPFSYIFISAFENCTSLQEVSFELGELSNYTCYNMFCGCTSLKKVQVTFTELSGNNSLLNWLSNVSPTGDFYCPAELTIPTGADGIPSGWTRHDI